VKATNRIAISIAAMVTVLECYDLGFLNTSRKEAWDAGAVAGQMIRAV
jgi:hypothetical protein